MIEMLPGIAPLDRVDGSADVAVLVVDMFDTAKTDEGVYGAYVLC